MATFNPNELKRKLREGTLANTQFSKYRLMLGGRSGTKEAQNGHKKILGIRDSYG